MNLRKPRRLFRSLLFALSVAGLGLHASGCSRSETKRDPAPEAGEAAQAGSEDAELRRNIEATENLIERSRPAASSAGAAAKE